MCKNCKKYEIMIETQKSYIRHLERRLNIDEINEINQQFDNILDNVAETLAQNFLIKRIIDGCKKDKEFNDMIKKLKS